MNFIRAEKVIYFRTIIRCESYNFCIVFRFIYFLLLMISIIMFEIHNCVKSGICSDYLKPNKHLNSVILTQIAILVG